MAVARIGRVLDVVAGAFVMGGAAFYAHSYLGLQRLRAQPMAEYSTGMSIDRLAEFNWLERVSLFGLALAIIGIAVAVTAALVARRVQRAGA